MMRASFLLAALLPLLWSPGAAPPQETPALELRKGDMVVLVGNTLAERMQHFNHFETLLMVRFAGLQLRVRNLGWSGDTLTLQPRPLNFGETAAHLQQQKADVIIAFFGASESFAGEAGLPAFERDLDAYIDRHAAATYNGRSAPRLALVSPIAHERLTRLVHVDAEARNRELQRYTETMRQVAARKGVPFADLFTPSRAAMEQAAAPLTDNGIHLNEHGDRVIGGLLMDGLGFTAPATATATAAQLKGLEALRREIAEKNQQFFYRWRPLNAEYVVGRRVEPFGSVSFPPEMRQLDEIVTDLDNRIWKRARAIGAVRFPPGRPAAPAAPRPPAKRNW